MANVKITQKAYDLAKEAAKLGDQGKKLTIVDFVSQAVIQVAQEKFEAEEQRLRALREGPPKQKETKDGSR